MSGHSKWSTIKRKKGLKDQQRGAIFSKLSRAISLAVVSGGGIADPASNVKLRLAIEQAKRENMPKANIERAIERAVGGEGKNLSEVVYEGFAPGGVFLIILATTDNPNRTHSAVKSMLDKSGGKLGGENSVAYMFVKCGVVVFDKKTSNENDVFEFSDSIGALDLVEEDDQYIAYIPFEKIGQVDQHLKNLKASTIDVFYRPKDVVKLPEDKAGKIDNMIEMLEDQEDVTRVYSNFEIEV